MTAKKAKLLPAKGRKAMAAYLLTGRVVDACKKAGISRTTFYVYKREFPDFRQAIEDFDERLVDDAVSGLLWLLTQRDLGAIIWTMKCKGRARGWFESKDPEQNATAVEAAKLFQAMLGLGVGGNGSNGPKRPKS